MDDGSNRLYEILHQDILMDPLDDDLNLNVLAVGHLIDTILSKTHEPNPYENLVIAYQQKLNKVSSFVGNIFLLSLLVENLCRGN